MYVDGNGPRQQPFNNLKHSSKRCCY